MRLLPALCVATILSGCSTPADAPPDAKLTEGTSFLDAMPPDAMPPDHPAVDAGLRDAGAAPSRASVVMWLSLADGSSSVSKVIMRAWSSGPVAENRVRELVSSVLLESPAGEPIGAVPVASRVEHRNGVAEWWTFELDVSSFAGTWIHVRVAPPEYAAMSALANVVALDDGSYLARYFTGSDPRLLSMNVCAKQDGKHAFVLRLSEDADAAGTETDGVELASPSRGPLPCSGALMPREIYVLCGGVVETERLELSIRPGLVGIEGHVHAFTIAELPASRSEPACRELRVW